MRLRLLHLPGRVVRHVPATVKRDPALYYGAPCTPTVKGVLIECASRTEYDALRDAYEVTEGNCNTCIHLRRPTTKQPKHPDGWLTGTCARTFGMAKLTFHPEDPLQLPCHAQRFRIMPQATP